MSHHDLVAPAERESVHHHVAQQLGRVLLDDVERIGLDDEVVVLRVVVGGVEGDAVKLLSCQVPCVGSLLTLVVAGTHEQRYEKSQDRSLV